MKPRIFLIDGAWACVVIGESGGWWGFGCTPCAAYADWKAQQ